MIPLWKCYLSISYSLSTVYINIDRASLSTKLYNERERERKKECSSEKCMNEISSLLFFAMRKINVSYSQRSLIRKKKNRYLDYDSIEFTGDEEYFQIQYIIKSLLEVQKPICRNSASLFRTLLCIDIYLPAFYTSISGYKICVCSTVSEW